MLIRPAEPCEREQDTFQTNQHYRRIALRLLPFLVLCYIAAYIDRSNIGLAKIQFMNDLRMGEASYGLAGGAFYLGYSLFGIPTNLWLGKHGARRSLSTIMVLWGAFSTALAFAEAAAHVYVLRFLVGAAEAGFLPGVILYLSRWVPQQRRGRFNAVFLMAIPLSGVVGGPLGGFIMQQLSGSAGLKGWQWLFIIEGLPAILLGALVLAVLKDGPSDAAWLTADARRAVEADIASSTPRGSSHASIWPALRDSRFYALVLMAISAVAGSAAIGLWLPTVIRDTGVTDPLSIGALSAIPYTVAIIVQYWIAHSSDTRNERRWHVIIPIAVAACGWLLLPTVNHSFYPSLLLMIVIACGTFGVTGPFWALPTALLSGTAAAGGLAIMTTLTGIAAFISPILVGAMAQNTDSLTAGEIYYAGLLALGAIAISVGLRSGSER